MAELILGTAGHIDHGKSALVLALTGTDPDRLKEEKARGITIDLGFARLHGPDGLRLGVVDVPGHEDFVRTMVAGASGMDLVLLVVAADEGFMPQTREHLAIARLLAVPRMVVALTKADLAEPEWLALVEDDVRAHLAAGPFADAPIIATSTVTGEGLDELTRALAEAARSVRARDTEDLARLPIDRVFTVQGTGTVVTGTLWSGTLRRGQSVRLLPSGVGARIRGVQVHGDDVHEVPAGSRTAVALTGPGVDRSSVERGMTLVDAPSWGASRMLTVRVRLIEDTPWSVEHNQRLHVHSGTHEVLARCALLEGRPLRPGDTGWIQLRLERPTTARAGDHVILRSYSPVTTVGGGLVAEPHPPKRRHVSPEVRSALDAVLDGSLAERLAGALWLAGWAGAGAADLALATGARPADVESALRAAQADGAAQAEGRWYPASVAAEADRLLLDALAGAHAREPLLPKIRLPVLRAALPAWAGPGLADARLAAMAAEGRLEVDTGGVRLPSHRVALTPDQQAVRAQLAALHDEAGWAPPGLGDLPAEVRARPDLDALLRHMAEQGELVRLEDELWMAAAVVAEAEHRVRELLGGRSGLAPTDFRDALPVSRKVLMLLLAHLDRQGITLRRGDGRDVLDSGDAPAP